MLRYLLRRVLYAVPILIGVNLITFALFFMVNSPDDMARMQLGVKRVTPEAIQQWKAARGYDKPLFVNESAEGMRQLTETVFYEKSVTLFAGEFGRGEDGRAIGPEIRERMGPSLAIALPTFVVGLGLTISLALMLVLFRGTWLDRTGVVICVGLMSISSLFFILGGQFVFARILKLVPISGYDSNPWVAWHFLILPVAVSIVAGLGGSTRWYRTLFLEEIGRDYVRTARAKGLSETRVLFQHVLRNGLIPILTGIVVVIPSLFLGSLLIESFFGIPGLGSYTIDAIAAQDFAVVRAMVFLGSVLYLIGLILTDLSSSLVDPRIRLR